VAKGVVGGTAAALLTYPLFVGTGFVICEVLALARGERNWREYSLPRDGNENILGLLLAVTSAPLMSLGVGFKTFAYLVGAENTSAVLALQFGGGFTAICGAAWIGNRTFNAAGKWFPPEPVKTPRSGTQTAEVEDATNAEALFAAAPEKYDDQFCAAPAFEGTKAGFVFKCGGQGVGYYTDKSKAAKREDDAEYPNAANISPKSTGKQAPSQD
jgi:hypothetical protein